MNQTHCVNGEEGDLYTVTTIRHRLHEILLDLNEVENASVTQMRLRERCRTAPHIRVHSNNTNGPFRDQADRSSLLSQDSDTSYSTNTSSDTTESARFSFQPDDSQTEPLDFENLILRPSASEAEIQGIQIILDTKLPTDYLEFLRLTNGLQSFPSYADPGLRAVLERPQTDDSEHDAPADEALGLYWQKVEELDQFCPAISWFPAVRSMVKISSSDEDIFVWLITPRAMHDLRRRRRDRSHTLHSVMRARDQNVQRGRCPRSSVDEGWGVLRWCRPTPEVLARLRAEGADYAFVNRCRQQYGNTSLYNSFTDYLTALCSSLRLALQ